jgi:hypothetical protein
MNWKSSVTILAVLGIIYSTASEAAKVHPVAKKLSGKKLEAFILKHGFNDGYFGYIFRKGGVFKGMHPHSNGMAGKWKVKGDTIIIKSHGLGGGMTEGDLGKDWRFDVEWRNFKLTSTGIAVVSTGKGGHTFKCDKKFCNVVNLGLIRPGHSDTGLYNLVLERVSKSEFEPVIYLQGPPAKKTRKITEIWYQETCEGDAKILLKSIEDLVGPAKIKLWTWGGPYRTITIVGQQKAPR